MSKTAVNIVFGTMTFGEKGYEGVRTSDPKEAQAILDTFKGTGTKTLTVLGSTVMVPQKSFWVILNGRTKDLRCTRNCIQPSPRT